MHDVSRNVSRLNSCRITISFYIRSILVMYVHKLFSCSTYKITSNTYILEHSTAVRYFLKRICRMSKQVPIVSLKSNASDITVAKNRKYANVKNSPTICHQRNHFTRWQSKRDTFPLLYSQKTIYKSHRRILLVRQFF